MTEGESKLAISFAEYEKSAAFIRERLGKSISPLPEVCLVLGSGLGRLAGDVQDPVIIPYTEIPGFPRSTVKSHAGKLIVGRLSGRPVAVLSGRFHYYEGYDMETVTFYVRVMYLLGVKKLVLTNAAGGVNESFRVGDLMLITDHIKLCAESPARGEIDPRFGERFFDMTHTYSPVLAAKARRCAEELAIPLREGVYFYMAGPQFETPAEIRAIRTLGGDAVGMSTVAEAIAASQCGMAVLGLSCITNLAAGMKPGVKVSDQEVTQNAAVVAGTFCSLMKNIIEVI